MILTVNIENKSFEDNHVLKDIKFTVKEKEIVCLIGPSGCGKSTILNILGKLDIDFEGKIYFHHSSKTGYMFQTDNLFPWKNILENVQYGLDINNINQIKSENLAIQMLKEVQLEEEKFKYPHELSGGMRQRISLARTMIMNPTLLLLDEPLAHLDMISKKYLTKYIRDFINSANMGAIIVTHSLEEAAFLADKVILLNRNPATILEQIEFKDVPFETRVKTLLDAIEKEEI
jgi:NitT/TauT family transport system ATP-binding protein